MKKFISKVSNHCLLALAGILVATTSSIISHRPEVPAELLKK